MKIHKYPGLFIDIEGIDGSGAHTQVELISKELAKMGLAPFVTKEPTDSQIGKQLHQFLKEKPEFLSPSTLELLFVADRGLHLDEVIVPKLKKREMVITDRYAWASVAYGSVYLSKEWLFDLNRDFIFPDLTIFIEVDPEVCLERLRKEKNGFELFEEEREFQQVASTYNWLATKYWWAPIITIDGERTKEEVCGDILTHIKNLPKFKKISK